MGRMDRMGNMDGQDGDDHGEELLHCPRFARASGVKQCNRTAAFRFAYPQAWPSGRQDTPPFSVARKGWNANLRKNGTTNWHEFRGHEFARRARLMLRLRLRRALRRTHWPRVRWSNRPLLPKKNDPFAPVNSQPSTDFRPSGLTNPIAGEE